MERLLDDVIYDLGELDFIEAVSVAGLAYADTLLSEMSGLEQNRLVGAALIASNARTPDLSRHTFQELVNSGRIGLLRSRAVRLALARYDRAVAEQEGFWSISSYEFSFWVESRVPYGLRGHFSSACADSSDPIWQKTLTACPFDLGEWSAEGLRRDLGSDEARRLITLYTHRHGGARDIVRSLRSEAEALRQTLEQESD